MKRNLTILLSLLFVGCGENEPKFPCDKIQSFVTDTEKNGATPIVDESGCDIVHYKDTIYFNPIINHSRIPNNK